MTAAEAKEIVVKKLGRDPGGTCFEYKNMFSFRAYPGQRIFVMKDAGKAILEEDMPDKLIPKERGMPIRVR